MIFGLANPDAIIKDASLLPEDYECIHSPWKFNFSVDKVSLTATLPD